MLGAIIGDTIGSAYEFHNIKHKLFPLFTYNTRPTDDSILTMAVAEILLNNYVDDKDKIIDTYKKWGKAYIDSGFGGRFFDWLISKNRKPYNSYGNGAAMRISPVGWFAKSEDEVKEFSRKVTEVTHNHPEGIKGAEVTAMCIFYARKGKSKEFIKDYASKHYNLDFDYDDLVENYRFVESCQGTVPQAIYCFLISRDFIDCVRTSISIGGDSDTLCAIACSIAEAYYKEIPEDLIKETLKRMPESYDECYPLRVINDFKKYIDY